MIATRLTIGSATSSRPLSATIRAAMASVVIGTPSASRSIFVTRMRTSFSLQDEVSRPIGANGLNQAGLRVRIEHFQRCVYVTLLAAKVMHASIPFADLTG